MSVERPGQASDLTRLVLVRHGEPDASVRGRCYGRLDPALSPRGHEQMRTVKRLLRGLPLSKVYSSPRRRALESARHLAPARSNTIVDDRLREIDFGELEGLTYDEIAAGFPETYDTWMRHPTDVAFPGGESFRAMTAEDLRVANNQRIKVVMANPDETYAELAKRVSIKSYPEETLRLINGQHPIGEPRAGDFVKIIQ